MLFKAGIAQVLAEGYVTLPIDNFVSYFTDKNVMLRFCAIHLKLSIIRK